MKNFDSIFAKAVKMLVEEKQKPDEPDGKNTPATPTKKDANSIIVWEKRGGGNWSNVIKGVRSEAEGGSSYDDVIKKSLAAPEKSKQLMLKLGITSAAKSSEPLGAVAEILIQALKNPVMSESYGTPRVTEKFVFVPFKFDDDDDDEDALTSSEIRNLTAYIHLTLVGAFNARLLSPSSPVKLSGLTQSINIKGVAITLS